MKAMAATALSQNVLANMLQAYVLVAFVAIFIGLAWRTFMKKDSKSYEKIANDLLKD
jgi:hypothetical protein